MAQFEYFIGRDGLYHWRSRANNGEIVAQSEAYQSKQGAQNGARLVKQEAYAANEQDLTGR